MRHAAEAGIAFFDTAEMRSRGASKQITERLPPKLFDHGDANVLAAKVYYPTVPGLRDQGLSRKHLVAAIDTSPSRWHGTGHLSNVVNQICRQHRVWVHSSPLDGAGG